MKKRLLTAPQNDVSIKFHHENHFMAASIFEECVKIVDKLFHHLKNKKDEKSC